MSGRMARLVATASLAAALWTCGFWVSAWAEQGEQIQEMEEVVVTGTKTPHTLKDTPVETTLISQEDIARSNAQTLMDVLDNVPGINTGMHNDVFGTYTWQARMRGMSINDGYALLLIDGQRTMGCGQSGGMGEYGIGLNQVPVSMIERIEIVKGPGSALYGSDAVAGVINIITKKAPEKPTTEAGVQYGLYDVRTKEGEDLYTGRSSQAQFLYGDTFQNSLGGLFQYSYEGSEGVDTVKEDQKRHYGLGKLDFELGPKLDGGIKGELSRYKEHPEGDPVSKKEDSYRLSGNLDFSPHQAHKLSLKGYTYNWDFESGWPGYAWGHKHGEIGYNQGEAQYTGHITDWNTLTIGAELLHQKIDYVIENPEDPEIPVEEDVRTASLYIQDEAALMQDLTLVPGVRFEDHSTFGSQVNPKLSLMYKLNPDTYIRASSGKVFKSPTIRQLYYKTPYQHGEYYIRSNPNLDPEKGWGYTLNIEHFMQEYSSVFSFGLFRNEINDKVIRVDTGDEYQGKTLKEYENVERAVVQGVELEAKSNITADLYCSFAYTFSDSKNKDTDKDLPYTPNHTVSLSPSYYIGLLDMELNTRVSYVGSQYADSEQKEAIDSYINVDTSIHKNLSNNTKLVLEVDNIFDSDGATYDQDSEIVGRSFALKLEGKL